LRGRRQDLATGDTTSSRRGSQGDTRDHRRAQLVQSTTLRRKLQDLDLEQQKQIDEDARRAQFKTSLKIIEEQFRHAEAERDRAFQDAELQQGRRWQESEEKLNAIFKAREDAHELTFEEQRNAQKTQSAWLAGLTESTLQASQQQQVEDCKELEQKIATIIEALLLSQCKAFEEEEHRRDSIVKRLVNSLGVASRFDGSSILISASRQVELR